MKAIVVRPGVRDSVHMRDMPDPELTRHQVAVKMIRAGLCGTDAEIGHGVYGEAPNGNEYLILGHENFGIVEEVGRETRGFKAGDLVVATVRRPCRCYTCRAGEIDMCSGGAYQERGILGRHGFMAEFYVESPRWLNKIPQRLAGVGVLLEPMSVVEKGIDHAFLLQRRFEWKPKTGLVLGAGPVGILAAAVMRARGLDTHVISLEPDTDARATLLKTMGVTYHPLAGQTMPELKKEMPPIDIAVEATGTAMASVDAVQTLANNGVLCLLSLTGGSATAHVPLEKLHQQIVLGNQVVFGSVNANPRHFAMGLKDLALIERKWPGVLGRLLTTRLPWNRFDEWFSQRTGGIKTTLEISS